MLGRRPRAIAVSSEWGVIWCSEVFREKLPPLLGQEPLVKGFPPEQQLADPGDTLDVPAVVLDRLARDPAIRRGLLDRQVRAVELRPPVSLADGGAAHLPRQQALVQVGSVEEVGARLPRLPEA